ncbi:RNA 2',3'-cyclic phosphodiesterase [Moorella sp. Hama-1]|uniref:RNA 2',3'-cyclic phosphodiesterase n=1 Tax=Moorella sp. Hama-1 TaxID=2138101 RepID=UPI000D65912E|nr:RNA 2',3'-cyclic phosphodiesterase [Moorella sp. Hama-1]MDN5361510.1 2,3-cyclic 3-phosphodiesterase [Moorella sp. (in: firmicutes)]BCV21166.1 RNA 2',3'-cyclic phosphodiesterase [Moorella sp. Hama-1]
MRLFIAINFSPTLIDSLTRLQAELRRLPVAVKWVNPGSLHLTLKFLGEVEPAAVGAMSVALEKAALGIKPWELEVKGAGVFPNWRAPRVIWVGVESGAPLYDLQRQVTAEYLNLGFKTDTFTPHLTLGRLRPGAVGGSSILGDRLRELAGVSWGRERVTAVSLMESRLTPRGALYLPLLTVNLEK